MIAQVVYLEAQAEQLEKFIIEVLHNAAESRKEAGVRQFDVLQQADAPTKFMLYEIYADQTALKAHRLTPHFKRWVESGVPLLVGDRVRTIYNLLG